MVQMHCTIIVLERIIIAVTVEGTHKKAKA